MHIFVFTTATKMLRTRIQTSKNSQIDREFTLVKRRPYCPGRPKELCFTTLSLAMGNMGMRLSVVKQSCFGPPGQYGRLVTRANNTALMAREIAQTHLDVVPSTKFEKWQRQRHQSMIWLVEWGKIIVLHVRHAFWCERLKSKRRR